MTLAELLVVLGLMAILLGFSVGVYQKLTRQQDLPAAEMGLRALLHRARNTAREEGFPVDVELDPVELEARARIRSWTGVWHFESDDLESGSNIGDFQRQFDMNGAFGEYGQVKNGALDPEGRIGGALRFDDPEQAGYMQCSGSRPGFNPTEGVVLQAWVLPRNLAVGIDPDESGGRRNAVQADEYMVICKGRLRGNDPDDFSYFLRLTSDYAVEAGIKGPPGSNENDGIYIVTTFPGAVRPERWSKLEMIYDGTGIELRVNGVRRSASPPLVGGELLTCPSRLETNPGPLYVSHPERSFFGMIDEVRIGVIQTPDGSRYRLPGEVTFLFRGDPGDPRDPERKPRTKRIRFDAKGRLDERLHPFPIQVILTDAMGFRQSDRVVRDLEARAGRGTDTKKKLSPQEMRTIGPGEMPEIPEDKMATITIEMSGYIH